MKTYNNNILIEKIENDNESDGLILNMIKKDYKKGKVVEDTEVYLTDKEKTTLVKDSIVLYRTDRETYDYKNNTCFISFNSVICIE